MTVDRDENVAKRRVRCLISYLSPFRIVTSADHQAWEVDVEGINHRKWDYVALHEMIGGVDTGLPYPYHMAICRDGALALPPIKELSSHTAAIEYFNRCLAALLIGGVYCEAVTADGLDIGFILDWKYIRSEGGGLAAPNLFHQHVRYLQSSPLEAVTLVDPPTVSLVQLTTAMKSGLATLSRVPSLRGEYLLRGVTAIARRDWGAGLASLWISIEQVLSDLWHRDVVTPTRQVDGSKARRDQLEDTRTWTASARIEMLFQKSILPPSAVALLSQARKARNELSHRGVNPTESDAHAAYTALCMLLQIALDGQTLPMFSIDLADHKISDPFARRGPAKVDPSYWMPIPKLPGEEELEHAEALATVEGRPESDLRES